MDLEQRTRRFGGCLVLCALLLRLTAAGVPQRLASWLGQSHIASFLIYLETGRDVRFSASEEVIAFHFRESPAPWVPEEPLPRFSGEDAALAPLYNTSAHDPDTAALLETPLVWKLADGQPRVLILHTHATESYTQAGETYEESSRFRTLEEDCNMISIGNAVAQALEEKGIGVIHDRTLHDYPSYNGSYVHARSTLEALLVQYPTIQLVLDLHRDASGGIGSQLRTEAVVEGQTSAQLMLVVGTNGGGQSHDGWEENLALGLKLHVQLERTYPGIMRPVSLRNQRFNQDLSPGALLVEVGAAGNTRQEALRAARVLAEAIAALAGGTAAE